jgi:hypothetical protein
VAAAEGELLTQDLAGVAHGQSLGGHSSPFGGMAPGPSRAATLRPPSPWRMPGRRGDHEDRSR